METIHVDFRNNSKPALIRAIMDDSETFMCDTERPGMPTKFCRIRVDSIGLNAQLPPHAHQAYIVLCRALITVLPPGDRTPNRVNVFGLLACDACEVLRPGNHWTACLHTKESRVVSFRQATPADLHGRILDIPACADSPVIMEPHTMLANSFWGCSSEALRTKTKDAWPDLTHVDFSGGYGLNTYNRLRAAGLIIQSLYVYLRIRGLLCPGRDQFKGPYLPSTDAPDSPIG